MHYLEMLLIGILVFFPLIDVINAKFKSQSKNIEFIKISISLWIPTIFLLYLYYANILSVASIPYKVTDSWQNILAISLIIIAISYLILLIKSITENKEQKQEVAKNFASFIDILPETKNQLLVFTLILSVSAGVCEEIIFRGYLFPLLDGYIGTVGAVIISSVVFGLWHIYLGWNEVLRTSIMGAIFCGVYLFTGNIIIPIILHIFIDVYSGVLCYFAMKKQ